MAKRKPYTLEPRGKQGILSVRFTIPGQREVFRSSGTTDERLANEWAARLYAEAYSVARLGQKPARYWTEAVTRWLAEHQHKRILNKDIANLRWLDPYLRDKRLTEIDLDLLAIIFAERKGPKTSDATVDRMRALVRSILRSCEDWGWIDRAPRIKLIAKPKEDYRWLTREEAERLHVELADHLKAPFRFALATGLREQNVLRLEWSRVDLKRKTMRVLGQDAKGRKAMGFPLNKDAMAILLAQRGMSDTWVFPSLDDDPYVRANNTGWRAAFRRSGVRYVCWHDLRHTWASWHVMSGTSLIELKELGGWRNIQSVMRYAHLAPEHLKGAAEKVAR